MQELLVQLLKALSDYKAAAPFLFIIIRSLAIIIPPIPGIVFDLAGILIFGWFWGFIYAEIGTMLGAMAAFFIARRFREPVIKRICFLKKAVDWEKKFSENKKFWVLVAFRLPTNTAFDYISYAAGLTTIKPIVFFFSTLLGNIPSTFLVYYFGGLSFQKGIYYSIAFLATLLIFWLIFWKTKLLKKIYKKF